MPSNLPASKNQDDRQYIQPDMDLKAYATCEGTAATATAAAEAVSRLLDNSNAGCAQTQYGHAEEAARRDRNHNQECKRGQTDHEVQKHVVCRPSMPRGPQGTRWGEWGTFVGGWMMGSTGARKVGGGEGEGVGECYAEGVLRQVQLGDSLG